MLNKIADINFVFPVRTFKAKPCVGVQLIDFAKRFGLSYSALNETLNAKRPITTEFALFLEAALGAVSYTHLDVYKRQYI